MPDKPRPPTDLRALKRREQRLLLFWVVFFLVIVGGVAIGLVYGWRAIPLGAFCLSAGAGVLGLLWFFLWLAEKLGRGDG